MDRPMCGWGRTSVLRGTPAGICAGPMWSKKTKGPTLRRRMKGKSRPTSNPPKSLRRASISSSIRPVSRSPVNPYGIWGLIRPSGTAVVFFTPRITIRLSMFETRPRDSDLSRRKSSKARMSRVTMRSS